MNIFFIFFGGGGGRFLLLFDFTEKKDKKEKIRLLQGIYPYLFICLFIYNYFSLHCCYTFCICQYLSTFNCQ